jgi:hypothetical protein
LFSIYVLLAIVVLFVFVLLHSWLDLIEQAFFGFDVDDANLARTWSQPMT